MALTSMPDGRWLQVNRALCELTGYSADELLELRFPDITHPDDLELDLALQTRLLAGELERYELEKRYIRKDGTGVVLLSASLVRGEDGRPLYGIGQVQDITARKQLELRRGGVRGSAPRSRFAVAARARGARVPRARHDERRRGRIPRHLR